MSEPILNVMKIMLLAGLYLFFVRVLWSVYNELRDPRTRVQVRPDVVPAGGQGSEHGATMRARRREPASGAAEGVVSGGVAVAPVVQVGQLSVIEPAEHAGLTWALGNEITIGRAPTCGIQIGDTYASGLHARIFNRAGVFVIEDLDSRNGTVVNASLIDAATELRPGDRLQFGTTVLEFS
ncbi:MAG: FHA domain-containing protein [Actinomycetota bacterium]